MPVRHWFMAVWDCSIANPYGRMVNPWSNHFNQFTWLESHFCHDPNQDSDTRSQPWSKFMIILATGLLMRCSRHIAVPFFISLNVCKWKLCTWHPTTRITKHRNGIGNIFYKHTINLHDMCMFYKPFHYRPCSFTFGLHPKYYPHSLGSPSSSTATPSSKNKS